MHAAPAGPVRIAAGRPVLVTGFTLAAPFRPDVFGDGTPDIVLAGRLIEHYVPGLALLMEPGMFAGSIAPRGFDARAFTLPDGDAFVVMRHRHHDAHGAYLYFAMEDDADTAAIVESARAGGMLRWPDPLRFAKAITARVAAAYRSLDPLVRASIRA